MIQVPAHNNNGLFRRKNYSKSHRKPHGRLFIRRSKIYHSLTNNSELHTSPYYDNFTVNYRPPTTQLRSKYLRENRIRGAGDEQIILPSSNEQKQIDFTELEQIFDNAIRNRIPLELYKTKSPIQTSHYSEPPPKLTHNPLETRIELMNPSATVRPFEENRTGLIRRRQYRKIALGITIVFLSALIGFTIVFIFVK
ncbi:unnamed protein product [Adineta ricciae]|uniref:Uncharacterized protein n=1 Tax=Adineta ricciae TaxID=249248 RepID=A0A815X5P5_ADIRI|nr:unnamed protein product [Adineta ricciae]